MPKKLCYRKYVLVSINPILHGGGSKSPPRQIIARRSLGNGTNGPIFHDFVPFNIQKVMANPFLEFFFKILRNFASKAFGQPQF